MSVSVVHFVWPSRRTLVKLIVARYHAMARLKELLNSLHETEINLIVDN